MECEVKQSSLLAKEGACDVSKANALISHGTLTVEKRDPKPENAAVPDPEQCWFQSPLKPDSFIQ